MNIPHSLRSILLMLLLGAFIPAPADAQFGRFGRKLPGGEGAGDAATMSADGVERREGAITPTALTPEFPQGFACVPIASGFASSQRYDGSQRRGDRFGGLHGGMDLSLKEGTPLLAMAAGEVIASGEGGQLEGVYLWLRHAPAETGHPFWVFSKYQHLSAMPVLKPGDRVRAGEVVARSGATGTAGPHYGAAGYPHLHLSTFYGPSAEYTVKGIHGSMVQGRDAKLDDPLIIYLRGVESLDAVRALSAAQKSVRVGVRGEDGALHPADSATVWPVSCKQQ